MATDFKIILFERHHFGDAQGTFSDIEPGLVFKGRKGEFTFSCPNINPLETAVLMFESREVRKAQNDILRINGHKVKGGIPASPDRDEWNGNIQLVAKNILKSTGNKLLIEAKGPNGSNQGNLDDFILDNMVIMYKTKQVATHTELT